MEANFLIITGTVFFGISLIMFAFIFSNKYRYLKRIVFLTFFVLGAVLLTLGSRMLDEEEKKAKHAREEEIKK